MMRVLLVVSIGAVILGTSVQGQSDLPQVYSEYELQEAANKYIPNLRGVWTADLVQKLPPAQRAEASRTTLNLPLRGQVSMGGRLVTSNSPFTYYAVAASREVTIPILSVKFLDDISTAVAWLDARKCEPALAYDYAGIIGHQDPAAQPNGRFPSALRAFRIPDNVFDDAVVYDVSGKLLKSGIYFLMAHELAHVLYGHAGSSPGAEGQAREIAADNFAMEVMRNIAVPPAGMVVLFGAASRYEESPSPYMSSHPLSTDRLASVARYIRQNTEAFARLQPNSSGVALIASQLDGIARALDDPDMRSLQRNRNMKITTATLATACR